MIVISIFIFYYVSYAYGLLHNLFNNLSNTVILLAPSFSIGIKEIETFFK